MSWRERKMITWLRHSNWDWLKVNRTNQFVFLWWDRASASASHNYCTGNSYYYYSNKYILSPLCLSSLINILTRDQVLTQLHLQPLTFTLYITYNLSMFSKRSYLIHILYIWHTYQWNHIINVNKKPTALVIIISKTLHIYFPFGRYLTLWR